MSQMDAERAERAERFERCQKTISGAPQIDREALGQWLQRWELPPNTPLTFVYSPSEVLFNHLTGFGAETVYAPCSGRAWASPWKVSLPAELQRGEIFTSEPQSEWPGGFPMLDMRGKPIPQEYHDLFVEVRFRVWKLGSTAFLETRWNPVTRQTQYNFRDFDPTIATHELEDLLKVLRIRASRGRPRNITRQITSREMLTQIIRDGICATKAASHYTGKRVTQQDVVDNSRVWFGHVRDLTRQCIQWGIAWQDFRAELK
jgi:hypothetical protein